MCLKMLSGIGFSAGPIAVIPSDPCHMIVLGIPVQGAIFLLMRAVDA